MQRAATETEAANGALAHCSQPPIASIMERRAAAIACRTRFADARDAVLREYPWNFAKAHVVPALETTAGLGRFKKRYALPDDCVRVREIEGLGKDEWEIEASSVNPGEDAQVAQILATNAVAPLVEYTRRVENPGLWDALFLQAFQLMLGARIAPLVARNQGLAETLEARALALLKPAKRVDAQEQARREVTRDTSWIRARRGIRS